MLYVTTAGAVTTIVLVSAFVEEANFNSLSAVNTG